MPRKITDKLLAHHKKLYRSDKLYGTTTMGTRGQIVIPAKARQALRLKPGDELIVMGRFGKALGIIKSTNLGLIVKQVMSGVAGTRFESLARRQVEKLLGRLTHKR